MLVTYATLWKGRKEHERMSLVHRVKGWFPLGPIVMVRVSRLPFSTPFPLEHLE